MPQPGLAARGSLTATDCHTSHKRQQNTSRPSLGKDLLLLATASWGNDSVSEELNPSPGVRQTPHHAGTAHSELSW